ncbi:hypothetical protein SprV_0401540200 [Sparganum proliferum]
MWVAYHVASWGLHLGDDEEVVRLATGVADHLRYHYVLSSSPPNENIVQQLTAPLSGVHPGGFLPYRQAEECVGQQEMVFSSGSQEKAIVAATADPVRTQHSSPANAFSSDADIEVTKGN